MAYLSGNVICRGVVPQLVTVLGTELIRALRALERRVGVVPEALRVHHDAQLPDQPGRYCHDDQRDGVEAAHEDKRREHHEMVPVEDAAGGAAAVLHDEPEGAPDEHADEVADVEQHRDHEERRPVYDAEAVQQPYRRDEQAPEDEHLVRGAGGGRYIVPQRLVIYLLADRSEAVCKELLRAERHLVLYGHYLQKHVCGPNHPEQVQRREAAEKIVPLQHVEGLRAEDPKADAGDENQTAPYQSCDISLSCG